MSTKYSENNNKYSLNSVLERLKVSEGWRFDTDAATALDMDRRSLAGFKSRDSLPFDYLVSFAREKGYSLEWVINGRGPEKVDMLCGVAETSPAYSSIDYTLFDEVSKAVHELINEAGVEIKTEHDQSKFDYLLAYSYDQVLKNNGKINKKDIASLVKLAM